MLRILASLLLVAAGMSGAHAQDFPKATLYKNPQCGCCESYADYLRADGFKVEVKPTFDLAQISSKAGIPAEFEGCHTMFIGGYVVDGHVPVQSVKKLLTEKPDDIVGITVPGMPMGSPGMTGEKSEPLTVYTIHKGRSQPTIYAKE